MKIPVIIQARMSSERLPGKVLQRIHGVPLLEIMIERLRSTDPNRDIIIATSYQEDDNAIERFCMSQDIKCFRGDLNNVAKRFKDLIEEIHADAFVRICADSPLIDPKIIDRSVEEFKNGEYDIVTNVLERTFPKGQSVEVVRVATFLKNFEKITQEDDCEHVTSYFYKNRDFFKIFNIASYTNYNYVNLCVDTEDNFNHIKELLEKLKNAYVATSWKEMVALHHSMEKTKS